MFGRQGDLFGGSSETASEQQREVVDLLRTRLRATLSLVKSAPSMPWTDQLSIIREDNAFRYAAQHLPAEEGKALWAEFDAEMDRLYTIMNEGKDLDPVD